MNDKRTVITALLFGMVAGAGLALAIIMKQPPKPVKAEALAPRFKVLCREKPVGTDGYAVIVLRDTELNQDYLAYRGGLVLLGRGTNETFQHPEH